MVDVAPARTDSAAVGDADLQQIEPFEAQVIDAIRTVILLVARLAQRAAQDGDPRTDPVRVQVLAKSRAGLSFRLGCNEMPFGAGDLRKRQGVRADAGGGLHDHRPRQDEPANDLDLAFEMFPVGQQRFLRERCSRNDLQDPVPRLDRPGDVGRSIDFQQHRVRRSFGARDGRSLRKSREPRHSRLAPADAKLRRRHHSNRPDVAGERDASSDTTACRFDRASSESRPPREAAPTWDDRWRPPGERRRNRCRSRGRDWRSPQPCHGSRAIGDRARRRWRNPSARPRPSRRAESAAKRIERRAS